MFNFMCRWALVKLLQVSEVFSRRTHPVCTWSFGFFFTRSLYLAELLAVSHPFSGVVPSWCELRWLVGAVILLG